MKETYGKSYFGEVTNRLGRLLGLDGRIPVDLAQSIQPVVLVGDGTLPGMAYRAGKRWACDINGGANQGMFLRADPAGQGLIVEGWQVGVTGVTGLITLDYFGATAAAALGATTVAGAVLDSGELDRPGILTLQGNAFAGGTTVGRWPAIPINTSIPPVSQRFYLSPGTGLAWRQAGVGGIVLGTVFGRLFA